MGSHLNYYDQLPIPIIAIDKNLKLKYFNYLIPSFLKRPPRLLKDSPDVHGLFQIKNWDLKKNVALTYKEKTSVSSEEIEIQIDNETLFFGVIKLTFMPESDLIIMSFKDMTIERHLYAKYRDQLQKIKEDHEQIVQADKLRTIGELTAGVSHEITNPLTIALGNVDVLELSLKDKKSKSYLSNVKESLDRINNILCNMKLFLHKSEDHKEFVALNKLAEHIAKQFESELNKHKIKFSIRLPEGEIVGHVGVLKMEQVFTNILKNSIDALKNIDVHDKNIVFTFSRQKDGSILIRCEDNGPGLDKKDWDKVFSPFFTTKEIGEGVGLGLSLTKKFIESHDGTIYVQDKKTPGFCLEISLPTPELSSLTTSDAYLSGRETNEEKKWLVIDTSLKFLNLFSEFFERNKISYIGAQGLKEIKALINQIELAGVIINDQKEMLQLFLKETTNFKGDIFFISMDKNVKLPKNVKILRPPLKENDLVSLLGQNKKKRSMAKKVKRKKK